MHLISLYGSYDDYKAGGGAGEGRFNIDMQTLSIMISKRLTISKT